MHENQEENVGFQFQHAENAGPSGKKREGAKYVHQSKDIEEPKGVDPLKADNSKEVSPPGHGGGKLKEGAPVHEAPGSNDEEGGDGASDNSEQEQH